MVEYPYVFCPDPDRMLYPFNVDVEDVTNIDVVVDLHLDLRPLPDLHFLRLPPLSTSLLLAIDIHVLILCGFLPLVPGALFLRPHPNISYRTVLELSSTDVCLFFSMQ